MANKAKRQQQGGVGSLAGVENLLKFSLPARSGHIKNRIIRFAAA
jgi:hypothetical protein